MKKIGAIVLAFVITLHVSLSVWAGGSPVCEEKLFGVAYSKTYACDIKKDTSGVKAPIKNACYYFDMGKVSGDFGYYAERPRAVWTDCSCEPTGFNHILADQSTFFLCSGSAHNPFTWKYEPAGFRGKAFIQNGQRKIIGEFQMGRDVWKVKCKIDNNVCPQPPPSPTPTI